MGIDRIGKGGAPPVVPETQGPAGAERGAPVEKTFSVDRPDPTRAHEAAQVERAGAATPLERLRAGEIDVDGYVDLKVDEATRGLDGLPPSDLEDLRELLREKLVTDPGFSDLIRSATGKAPAPPED